MYLGIVEHQYIDIRKYIRDEPPHAQKLLSTPRIITSQKVESTSKILKSGISTKGVRQRTQGTKQNAPKSYHEASDISQFLSSGFMQRDNSTIKHGTNKLPAAALNVSQSQGPKTLPIRTSIPHPHQRESRIMKQMKQSLRMAQQPKSTIQLGTQHNAHSVRQMSTSGFKQAWKGGDDNQS